MDFNHLYFRYTADGAEQTLKQNKKNKNRAKSAKKLVINSIIFEKEFLNEMLLLIIHRRKQIEPGRLLPLRESLPRNDKKVSF